MWEHGFDWLKVSGYSHGQRNKEPRSYFLFRSARVDDNRPFSQPEHIIFVRYFISLVTSLAHPTLVGVLTLMAAYIFRKK